MSTLAPKAPRVKSSKGPRPFTCSFVSVVVEINDHRYSVDATDPGESGSRSFRLTKHAADSAVYDVIRTPFGTVECDCPDYEARHKGNGFGMCKHGRAVVELGLMPAPLAPAAVAPCCTPSEPAPCLACTAEAPALAPEIPPGVELLPPELVDPLADDDSDPASWPAWTDADRWEADADDDLDALDHLLSMPADDSPNVPTMPFPAWIALQASAIRSYGTDAARWLAGKLDALADQAGALRATTPDEFDARDLIMSPVIA